MPEPQFRDFEVQVTLNVTTTDDDITAALRRSGIVPNALIGEALIEDVEVVNLVTD